MKNKKRLIQVLTDVEKDTTKDVSDFEGQPFTGKTVGTYLGYQSAAIVAISRSLRLVIEAFMPDDEPKIKNMQSKPQYHMFLTWVRDAKTEMQLTEYHKKLDDMRGAGTFDHIEAAMLLGAIDLRLAQMLEEMRKANFSTSEGITNLEA